MQDGSDCKRGRLFKYLFAVEDGIGVEDQSGIGKRKRDGSIFKLHVALQNYPYLIKDFCMNLSIPSWIVSNCAFIIFCVWPKIMGSGRQKCLTFTDFTQKCFEPLKCSLMCAGKSDSTPSTWTLKIHECTWPLCLFLVPIKERITPSLHITRVLWRLNNFCKALWYCYLGIIEKPMRKLIILTSEWLCTT